MISTLRRWVFAPVKIQIGNEKREVVIEVTLACLDLNLQNEGYAAVDFR